MRNALPLVVLLLLCSCGTFRTVVARHGDSWDCLRQPDTGECLEVRVRK